MRFGLWEGVLWAELEDRFCRAGRIWGENPCCVTPPEGEPFEQFSERLLGALKRAIARTRPRNTRRAIQTPAAVGVVLRPVGEALLRCTLAGLPATELRLLLKERPAPAWFEVDVEEDWVLPTRPRRQTASAA
jgi:broad specificity phosphatase PhoE